MLNPKTLLCAALAALSPAPSRLQDKILQSMGRGHGIMVTNDGATILKSLYVDNPAAKVLVGACPRNTPRIRRIGVEVEPCVAGTPRL